MRRITCTVLFYFFIVPTQLRSDLFFISIRVWFCRSLSVSISSQRGWKSILLASEKRGRERMKHLDLWF
jgi:hypothetical protein